MIEWRKMLIQQLKYNAKRLQLLRLYPCLQGQSMEQRSNISAKLLQSCPTLCDPMNYIACQAPLSMGFYRQEYWSGLPCPSPGDLPDPGIETGSLRSHEFAGKFFTLAARAKPCFLCSQPIKQKSDLTQLQIFPFTVSNHQLSTKLKF